MLRLLIVALLIGNGLFFAWSQGWLDQVSGMPAQGDREPQRLAQQVHPERVRILAPAASAPAAAAAVAPGGAASATAGAASGVAAAATSASAAASAPAVASVASVASAASSVAPAGAANKAAAGPGAVPAQAAAPTAGTTAAVGAAAPVPAPAPATGATAKPVAAGGPGAPAASAAGKRATTSPPSPATPPAAPAAPAASGANRAPPTSAAPGPAACLEAGPFTTAEASTAESTLRASLGAGTWTRREVEGAGEWMIYMGPYPDAEWIERKKAELSRIRGGVTYEEVSTPAELARGLSLGRFTNKATADNTLNQYRTRGIRTARVVKSGSGPNLAYLRLAPVNAATAARLAGVKLPQARGFSACGG